MTMIHFWIE